MLPLGNASIVHDEDNDLYCSTRDPNRHHDYHSAETFRVTIHAYQKAFHIKTK